MPLQHFVAIGDSVSVSKTMTESDLAFFAAVSGDFDPIHMDAHYAATSPFGQRIAHGILAMALLSTVAARTSERAKARDFAGTSVSIGFDRIRFPAPVFIGDTLTATYTIRELDEERRRSHAEVTVAKPEATVCVAGTHVMAWLPAAGEADL